MSYEDFDDAKAAIVARDGGQLWESDYYEDATRWIHEARQYLPPSESFDRDFSNAYQTAENLRAAVFQNCVNSANNAEKINSLVTELSEEVSDLIDGIESEDILNSMDNDNEGENAQYISTYEATVRLELVIKISDIASIYDWSH